ncbi:hypothetical protein BN961_03126 [Afipia felis]|uniref:Uncharacterized protein n=1 Tax=Afipia felis TaxID=1035 RepID=A0A090MQQ5_AFIFE|nr:hypothetical protein [Afipia felis]CEG09696.1 hypothetical protein BN961_03126 [Afipia felis]
MGLPPKSYFHLTEIAERWNASIPDLACYTIDGLLEVAVMTIGTRVETGRFEVSDRGMLRVMEGEKILHGPQAVVSSDLWPVFRNGVGKIARFKPRHADGYIDLSQDVDFIAVTLQDLLVTRAERDRFEMTHGLATNETSDQPPEQPTEKCLFLQRNNYAEVVLNGEVFRLGLLQASIVRELHRASQSDNPWRHGKELLANSNARTMRMVDLFKTKRNWRTLIASDGRGYYRLNLPDRPAARLCHQAYRRLRFALAG